MIYINFPKIEELENTARLSSVISIDGQEQSIWFEVDKKNKKYLEDRVIDAFIVGMLPFAMRNKHNIHSDAYISEELLFNLDTYLFPVFSTECVNSYLAQIKAPTLSYQNNAKGVGTGVSGGVDSSDVIVEAIKQGKKYPSTNLTHLMYFMHDNKEIVPGEGETPKFRQEQADKEYNIVHNIAQELKLPIITISSNIYNISGVSEVLAHTYHGNANVFALAKLFKTYFYASAHHLNVFNIKKGFYNDSEYANLFILQMLSTSNLRFYFGGISRSRLEKTKIISKEKWVQKYMNVCFPAKNTSCGVNCRIGKCMRTMWDLEVLGKLNNFNSIFDIDEFRKNKRKSIFWLYRKKAKKDLFSLEAWEKARQQNIISNLDILIAGYTLIFKKALRLVSRIIPIKKLRRAIRAYSKN
ncbi:MAG: hypothetical protein R3Y43_06745 [Alphaproteobacteria bacterium]